MFIQRLTVTLLKMQKNFKTCTFSTPNITVRLMLSVKCFVKYLLIILQHRYIIILNRKQKVQKNYI